MNRNTLAVLIACALLSSSVRSLEAATCGNGIREPGEQCDDGNLTNLDGCSAQCKFEQSQRINQFKMQFAPATSCSANAFGGAFKGAAQPQIQTSIDTAVTDGTLSIIFNMLALDDLSGTSDVALAVGVLNGTSAAAAPGGTYNGNSDLDWWYTIDPTGLNASRIPLSQLNGSIAAKVLTAGPGNATLPFTFGGVITPLRMSSLRLSADNGASSTPRTSTGFAPPGHIAAEHLDPVLTSYASSGAGTAGELCGNLSAASLVQIPVPAALLSGGATACVEGYTAMHSMLDVMVGGCHVGPFAIVAISATQPDQQDLSVPAAGAGGLYRLSALANHHIDTCKDTNGATVNLVTCLDAAAYSSFFKFSTDRVIAGRIAPPTIGQIDPNKGPTAGGQSVTITGTNFAGAKVKVDTTDATVNTTSAGSVTFLTPGHAAATVDVIVSTVGGGSATATGGYTYVAAPAAPAGVTAAARSNTRVDVGWIAVSGATSYEVDRKAPGGGVTTFTPATNAFSDIGVVAGKAYLYRVRAVNAGGKSPDSAPALATTLFMANDPLTSTTPIRAIHLAQLRTAVNAVRTLANLAPASTTDSAVADTPIKAVHVTELRLALDAARGPLGLSTGGYTDSPLTGVRVKAIHFQELRTAAGTTPLPSVPAAMVVNELSTGTVSSASNEFIELFNKANTAVDLSDWPVVYRAAAAVSDTTLVTIPAGTTIQPGGFYLLGGAAYAGAAVADQSFTSGLSAVGGAVGIRNPAGTLSDSVGWGTATNALVEGTAAPPPPAGSGIDRQPDGFDTNNNATDFKVSATLTPRAPNQ